MVPRPKWKMVEDWDGPMWPVFSGLHSGPTFVLPPLRITLHHRRRRRVYSPRLPSLFLWLLFSTSFLSPRRLLLLFFLITNFITNCLSSFYCIWDFVGLLTWMSIFILGPNLKSGGPLLSMGMNPHDVKKKKNENEMLLYTPYFF